MPVYEIEVANKTNSPHKFAPIQIKVRSRFDLSLIHRDRGDPAKALAAVTSVIPGEILRLDTGKRIVAKDDPLRSSQEGRTLWESLKKVFKQFEAYFQNSSGRAYNGLEREYRQEKVSNDTLKAWGYWMSRMIIAGQARYCAGSDTLPPPDEIDATWPGRRLKSPYSQTVPDPHNKEAHRLRYTEEVPVVAGSSSGGSGSGGSGSKR